MPDQTHEHRHTYFINRKKKRGRELPGENMPPQHFSMIVPVDAEVIQE